MRTKYPDTDEKLVFNEALKRMLNALVDDLIAETIRRVEQAKATTLEAVRHGPERLVAFSPAMEELRLEAKRFLYAHLYNAPELQRDHEEAETSSAPFSAPGSPIRPCFLPRASHRLLPRAHPAWLPTTLPE